MPETGHTVTEVITLSKKEKKPEETVGFSNAREPDDSFDLVNMYGTYNIQPTADHGNEYPAIAQGLSKEDQKERKRAREEWMAEQAKRPQSGGALEADPAKGIDGELPTLPSKREKREQ